MIEQLTYSIKKLSNHRCKITALNFPLKRQKVVLEEVKIPSKIEGCTVVGIARIACKYLFNRVIINKLIIPNTIESIYENAFAFIDIDEVIFEENSRIGIIAEGAFAHTGIKKLDINASRALKLGKLSFDSINLHELDLTKCTKIKKIDHACFTSSHIHKVKLPSNLKALGTCMFMDNNITDISFLLELKDCTVIPERCFSSCKISEIPEEIFKRFSIGDMAFNDNTFENLKIPDYSRLGISVFSNNFHLKNVAIDTPSIPKHTFLSCDNLETVSIKNATEIHAGAFRQCAIKKLNLEDDKLQIIGDYAFTHNKLTKVSLKNTDVTTVGYRAFADNDLVSVELPYYLTQISSTSFDDNSKLGALDLGEYPFVEVKIPI